MSIPSVELYVVLILPKSREQSTLGYLPGNNLPGMMIQHTTRLVNFIWEQRTRILNFTIFG